jgi:hypothetical protein
MKIAIVKRDKPEANDSGFTSQNSNDCSFTKIEDLDCVQQTSADTKIFPTEVFETGRTYKTFIIKSYLSGDTDAQIGDYIYYQKAGKKYGYKIIDTDVVSLANENCCVYRLLGESINSRECKPLAEACGKTEAVEWQT